MSLQKEDVINIAHLARLTIKEEDISLYAQSLTDILTLIEQMSAIDTASVEPMAHPFDAIQRLREDKVTESNQREYFQSIASQTENGLYLVPKVME